MDNVVVGKLLICFFLVISSVRVFYIKRERIDALCVLAPVAFVLSLLEIVAHGADVFSISLFVASLISLLSNIRALERFSENLYVDRYSIPFVIAANVVIIISVAVTAMILYFYPTRTMPRNFNATENVVRMNGSFRSGFVPTTTFETATAIVTIVSANSDSQKTEAPIVVVLTDKRADTFNYRPYMMALAERGYTVVAADFYADESYYFNSILDAKFLRRFAMRTLWNKNKAAFDEKQGSFTRLITQEAASLVLFVQRQFGADKKIFLIGDGMAEEACVAASRTNSEVVSGYFLLSSVNEYKSAGFGFAEQAEPLIASYCLNLKRDNSFSVPRVAAEKTDEAIGSLVTRN